LDPFSFSYTQSSAAEGNRETQECSAFSAFPNGGADSSERLLLREGVIDKIPNSLCGNKGGKNVILVVGDGMGWEMVRAGAIARKVVNELESIGCDIAAGCVGNTAAMARFEGRTLADYYTEGMKHTYIRCTIIATATTAESIAV
jgi:hypothetical protein